MLLGLDTYKLSGRIDRYRSTTRDRTSG